ncbi:MAG TPA: zinc-binding dehydrogenase [Nitriliruptoraceae bacterium]|nr:zinc-binding dehydrogenase [Nitriliruptoraceae bacterium]
MLTSLLTTEGFRFEHRPEPVPDRTEVVLAPTAVGLCEGDTFLYRTRAESAVRPLVVGHEATGIVTGVGNGVRDVRVGDRVATLATQALAERVAVDADLLAPVAAHVPDTAALGEPIACCVHALARISIRPDDTVAVVGCGFMGLVCVALARLAGARVTAIEPIESRRGAALDMGADAAIDPAAATPEALGAAVGPQATVIEAAGNQAALDTATALTSSHGTLVVLAYHQAGGGRRTVAMRDWNYRALTVVNGHVRDRAQKAAALRTAMDHVNHGRLDVGGLVRTWPLAGVEAAIRATFEQRDDVVKAAIALPAP